MHEQRYIAPCGQQEQLPVSGGSGGRPAAQGGARGPAACSESRRARRGLRLRAADAACPRGAAAPRVTRLEALLRRPLNMGCSLCSLQKPEEQHRLLYEVCQVTAALYSVGV